MPSGVTGTWVRIVGLQGLAGATALATAMAAAALVPPATFGAYGLMLSVVQAAYGIGFAWLNHALFRYAREEYAARGTVTGTLWPVLAGHALLLVGAAACVFTLATPLSVWLTLPGSALGWCLAGLAALVVFEALTYAAQAGGHFRGYGLGQVMTKAGPLLAVLAILVLPAGGAIALFAGALGGWIAALVLTAAAVPRAIAPPVSPRPLLAYGWRLPFGTAAGVLATWLGVWFVRGHLGVAEAGLYAWANTLFGLVAALLLPLSAVLAPGMVDLRLAGRRDAIARQVRGTLAVALLAAALAPLGLALLRLLGGVVPDAYAPALPVLVILCGAAPAQLLAYALNPLLMAHEELVGRGVAANVVIAALIAAGNAVLVPLVGMNGAALATLSALWIAGLLWLGIASTLLPDRQGLWRPWLAMAVPVLAVVVAVALLPWPVALAAGIAATLLLLSVGRRLGWFAGVEALCAHLPRQATPLNRGLQWCGRVA
jgi:O-antigen/teichoic acid export membrane protein